MKPNYFQHKGNRINYNFWFIKVDLAGDKNSDTRIIFDAKGQIYFLKEQDELAKAGKPSAFDGVQECQRHNDTLWLRGDGSFKAGMRRVNRIKQYLPTGSVIRLRSKWVGQDVKFHVHNPNPKPTPTSFMLRSGYSKLSGTDRVFDCLVTTLRDAGYLVEVVLVTKSKYYSEKICGPWPGDYYSATFTGNNVTGAFSQESIDAQPSLCGRVGVDHYDHFNKWSQVAVSFPIPTNNEQMGELLHALKAEGDYVSLF
jgi:hypothetical protein